MSLETDLFQRITTHASTQPLLGVRFYPLVLPQGPTYSAATYRRVSTVPVYARENSSAFKRIRLQIDCYATSYANVGALADGIIAALESWSQADSPRIDRAALANRLDGFEDLLGDDARIGIWRIPLDFFIWYNE